MPYYIYWVIPMDIKDILNLLLPAVLVGAIGALNFLLNNGKYTVEVIAVITFLLTIITFIYDKYKPKQTEVKSTKKVQPFLGFKRK